MPPQLATKMHWRLLEENARKEVARDATRGTRDLDQKRDRKPQQAKSREKRKLEALERRPQQLEEGILHCPRHAAYLNARTRGRDWSLAHWCWTPTLPTGATPTR